MDEEIEAAAARRMTRRKRPKRKRWNHRRKRRRKRPPKKKRKKRRKKEAEMADDKKPYGDVEYADPGYQSDKQHRYPVDTEEHARAAWSYINKAENAAKYSSADLAKVKAKIRAAAKKFGIEIADDSESKASGESGGNGAIECRAAVQLNRVDRNELVFLPVGLHAITPVSGGIGKAIKVLVNAETA